MLDFPSYPQWASAHIRSIEIVDNKTSSTINTDGPPVGSKLKVVLKSMTFNPVVVVSTSPSVV